MFIAQTPSLIIRTDEETFLLSSVSDPVCALRMDSCIFLSCSWAFLYLPRSVVCVEMPCVGVASGWGSIQVVSRIADTAGCSSLSPPKPRVWPINFPVDGERQYHSWLWVKHPLASAMKRNEVNHFPSLWVNPNHIHGYSFQSLPISRLEPWLWSSTLMFRKGELYSCCHF